MLGVGHVKTSLSEECLKFSHSQNVWSTIIIIILLIGLYTYVYNFVWRHFKQKCPKFCLKIKVSEENIRQKSLKLPNDLVRLGFPHVPGLLERFCVSWSPQSKSKVFEALPFRFHTTTSKAFCLSSLFHFLS
jgi:hypothetical protein